MGSNIIRRVRRVDDSTLIETFSAISSIFPSAVPTILYEYAPGITFKHTEIAARDFTGKFGISSATLQVSPNQELSLSVNFQRQITTQTQGARPSALYDEYHIGFGRERISWEKFKSEARSVLEIVGGLSHAPDDESTVTSEEILRGLIDDFSATHRQMLASLGASIQAAEDRRIQADEVSAEAEKRRREEHKKALAEIEFERSKLSLQSHMSERRRLLETLTKSAQDRAAASQLPRAATAMRWGVFAASLMVSVTAGLLSFQSFATLSAGTDHTAIDWILLSRGVIGSVVAIGAAAYAAGWLKSFYEADAKAARDLQKFNYDLSRASWIIETVLEVQHEKKGEVPREWIEGVTHGLFDRNQPGSASDEGTQALGALLGFAGSASFGPEGARVDVGKSGARRLSKAIKGEGLDG